MMNKIPFRPYHLLALLKAYDQQSLPLDLFISHYFRANSALGSKDRAFIAETIYALIRWRTLLDYLSPSDPSWESRYQIYMDTDMNQIQQREDIPLSIRVSFPTHLFQLFETNYGTQQAIELCLASNKPAPTTVRVNTLKTTREELLNLWKDLYEVSPTTYSAEGIQFHKKINFFSLPEFKSGFFEVQDEGSQLLAQLVKVQPGQQVLDYCAGSGGKTLAFAPAMQHKGQIHVHDIRPHALQEARVRLKRAGIQNSQVLLPDSPQLVKLKKKMHWVLADVPCSGTGTLRRNPDMKWKFDEQTLPRLIGLQRQIFEKALSFMRPDGRIVYGTCSILKEENQHQLEHFLHTYQLCVEGDIFQSLPIPGGMDGFFGVVLKRA
jgi:16S rRNA (cytosine967-C5)-methyltransferase